MFCLMESKEVWYMMFKEMEFFLGKNVGIMRLIFILLEIV